MTKEQNREARNLRDSQLIQQFLNGDNNAFTKLFNLHHKNLYKVNFYRLQNHHDAEDAIQEESIILYKSLKEGKYTENKSFGSWLFRIVKNHIIDFLKKKKLPVILMDELPDGIEQQMGDLITSPENKAKLLKAINTLSPRDRKILHLRLWKKQKWEEIAKALNSKEKTIPRQYTRILKILKKKLEKNNF